MKRRRGSALLIVTLLGIMIVAMAAGMVSFSMNAVQTGYNLDLLAVCRYAAEGGLEEVKANLKHDDEIELSQWFTSSKYNGPQPAIVKTIGRANVKITFQVVDQPNGRYRAIVQSSLDKMNYKLSMDFTYDIGSDPGPMGLFSKYATFVAQDYVIIGTVYTAGYYHSNNYIKFNDSNSRFYKRITAANHFTTSSGGTYTLPYTMPAPWSSMFQSTETPSHDPNVGVIGTPVFVDIDAMLLPIANGGSNPSKLWIDPANPYYSSVAGTMNKADITFSHSAATQQTTATIKILNSSNAVLRTETHVVDPAKDTLIYSKLQVSSLKGTLYGRVGVASSYKPASATYSSSYGDSIYSTPSVLLTDDLILVDQNGNPKNWIYQGAGTGTPIKQLSGKYNFPNIPSSTTTTSPNSNSGTWHMSSMNATWDNVTYGPKLNPNFAPPSSIEPAVSIIANGDVVFQTAGYNGLVDAAIYVADPQARCRSSLSVQKGNLQIFGCRVTQQNPINASGSYGYAKSRHFTYDDDFLTTAPPFFISIPGAATANVTVTFMSITGGPGK
jgi:hypothetical protein